MSRDLPEDPTGYAVEVDTGVTHTRYADHAPEAHRTRTLDGVITALRGEAPVPCDECYPPPAPARRARRSRATRTASRAAEPVAAPEEPNVEPATRADVERLASGEVS